MTADVQAEGGAERPGQKAPFGAGGRGTGRILSEMRAAGAPALPAPGAAFRKMPAKAVVRRFSETLDDAARDPVIVTRHGRPFAVIMSVGRFELQESLVRKECYDRAAEVLIGAIEAAREGKLKTSAQLRLEARRLGQFADRRRK